MAKTIESVKNNTEHSVIRHTRPSRLLQINSPVVVMTHNGQKIAPILQRIYGPLDPIKLRNYEHNLNFDNINYSELKKLILESKNIISSLISNESVLEHETFADLLMALMHLRDEIIFVKHKEYLTEEDRVNMEGDLIRVYKALTIQWIGFLSHLKQYYPYQYSGAIKFNPFTLN